MFNRSIFKKTWSPEQQNDEFKTVEKFRELSEIEGKIKVFDDLLDSNRKNQSTHFLHNKTQRLSCLILIKILFWFTKRTRINNSNKNILPKQTLKVVEKNYRGFGGLDLSYDEFKDICKETWKDED